MATRPNFTLLRRFLGPKWLVEDGGESELLGYALDLVKDAFMDRLEYGLLARFPVSAPEDAITLIGRDRRVQRGINETLEAYRLRLLLWLDDRKTSGNPWRLMKTLSAYCGSGVAFRTVDRRGNWWTRDANGVESVILKTANWNWDGAPASRFSRFWLIVYPNGLWTAGPTWGAVGKTWGGGDPETWGTTATLEQVTTLRAVVADWMPAGTKCVNIIIALDPASFNPATPEPDGLWGSWAKNANGVAVPSRLGTARYFDGVSR